LNIVSGKRYTASDRGEKEGKRRPGKQRIREVQKKPRNQHKPEDGQIRGEKETRKNA
jgi:hypothetical protein